MGDEKKWNFDHLFEGSLDDRGTKVMYFLEGATALRERAHEQYAEAFLLGVEGPGRYEHRWAAVVEMDEMIKAFSSDLRMVTTLREKARQRLGDVGEDMIDRMEEHFASLLGRPKKS